MCSKRNDTKKKVKRRTDSQIKSDQKAHFQLRRVSKKSIKSIYIPVSRKINYFTILELCS